MKTKHDSIPVSKGTIKINGITLSALYVSRLDNGRILLSWIDDQFQRRKTGIVLEAVDIDKLAKTAMYLPSQAIPEDECPNCHNGTIGLEHGRLVCRGECGHDFGPHFGPHLDPVASEDDAIEAAAIQVADEAQGQEQPEPRLGET